MSLSAFMLKFKYPGYFLLMLSFLECQTSQNNKTSSDWVQLFNGRDLNDWIVKITGYPVNENYANTYRVESGTLKVSYDGYTTFDERFGVMFYKEKYSSYVLGVEYRFTGEQAPGGPGW